ncbi:MAG: LysR family transcriptional regulator [Lachnospiraceae bacterium]|nr:LysR family transcriptional regulator [Lachnospiraceae bacterium]
MDLKELEYIVAIADSGSISRAAEKLFIAQSSLSQFLTRYECDLESKLFVRTGSGVRTTPAGDIFVRNSRQILQQYSRVKAELKEADKPSCGRIIFGISSFRGSALIPPLLKRFRAEYPGVDIIIKEANTIDLRKEIAAGNLDMALVANLPGKNCDGDKFIMKDEVLLVANMAHPVMKYVHYNYPERPWIDLMDTAYFEYLLSNKSTVLGNVADELFKKHGISPVALNRDLTAAFSAEMACCGLGLALTYASCAAFRSDVEYMRIGQEGCFVDLMLTFPPDGYRTRSIAALETMIRDFLHRQDIVK